MRTTRHSRSSQNWKNLSLQKHWDKNNILRKKKRSKTNNAEKHAKRKFKVPFAKKNEKDLISIEKEALSSAKKEGATEHINTMLGKSDGVLDEAKLKTDNIVLINLLHRPSS